MSNAKQLAADLITSEEYGLDAAEGCEIGNSVAGSILSIVHGIPRQYAEQAVREALREIEAEDADD